MPSLIGVFILLIAIQCVFAGSIGALVPAAATIFAWGVLAFIVVPLTQMRVLQTASGAPNLASTLNQSAFNLGNATGAGLGGIAIESGVSFAHLPWVGAALSTLGLALVVGTYLLDRKAQRRASVPAISAPLACSAE